RPRRPGARGSHLAALGRLHRCARDQQSLHDTAQLPEQSALARKDRPQHSRYGGDVLPVRCGRKNVFLDPIPIGEHALLVTARAEIPRLARKREQVVVTAFGAIHAREPVVRVAAFEEALDDALFEQALQAPLGSQFREVAIGALIEGTRARLTLVIHAAFGRPARRSRASLAASRHDASNAATRARWYRNVWIARHRARSGRVRQRRGAKFVKDEIRYRSGASIKRLDPPDRTSGRYHYAFAFTSNQDLKMAQPLPGMKPRPDQALSLNMKLLSHHELQGFGGIGEGMGMQLARDGRRILWLAHESAPKNFTAVDVTDPKNPHVVVQTELPHAKVRSNSLDVVGDIMAVAYQTSTVNAKPAGFDLFDISKPENPKLISHFDASGAHSRGVHAVWFVDGEYVHMASGAPDFQPTNPADDQFYRIVDVRRPAKPEEAGRWWLPGTRVGDSTPPLARHPKFDSGYRAHNTNVFPQRPDRAYVGYI